MTTTLISKEDALLESLSSPFLKSLAEKIFQGIRLSSEEGNYLFDIETDESGICKLADYLRKEKVGDEVLYTSTYYVHPTNLCELSCPMCSYYAKPGWDTAWLHTPEQVDEMLRKQMEIQDISEVHVVGGLWRECDLPYYEEMFKRIKAIDSNLHIKALTPVEYDFLANLHGISVKEVFEKMISYGLGSLPGGGAEVLVEKIRVQVAPQKIDSDTFMNIHEIAHGLDLPTNVTMLFGHVEDNTHLVTHMEKVRELQDKTGGFKTFVPLRYHDENNALGKRKKRLKPKNLNRVYAISRLMIDNVPNLKVLWNYIGIEESLQLLNSGANDFSSTNTEEKIITLAGGIGNKITMDSKGIESILNSIKRTPKHAHSGKYNDN